MGQEARERKNCFTILEIVLSLAVFRSINMDASACTATLNFLLENAKLNICTLYFLTKTKQTMYSNPTDYAATLSLLSHRHILEKCLKKLSFVLLIYQYVLLQNRKRLFKIGILPTCDRKESESYTMLLIIN